MLEVAGSATPGWRVSLPVAGANRRTGCWRAVCRAGRAWREVRGGLYVVDRGGQVLCAGPAARLGARRSDRSDTLGAAPSSLPNPRHIVSYAPIKGTQLGVVVEEERARLIAPAFSFLVAISALMMVGLFISFWLLWIGFRRISSPTGRRHRTGQGVA